MTNGAPAGAVIEAVLKAMFWAMMSIVVPLPPVEADGAADPDGDADPDALGDPDVLGDPEGVRNSVCQQAGYGVAPGAGL
jgi:hypothetical protein